MYYFSKGTLSQGNIADYSEIPCTIGEENYTHYIAENLMGTNSNITTDKDKVTDKLATFIEIVGERMSEGNKEIATFKMFIGENEKDFNVTRIMHIITILILIWQMPVINASLLKRFH